jgi:hypothetical protein
MYVLRDQDSISGSGREFSLHHLLYIPKYNIPGKKWYR